MTEPPNPLLRDFPDQFETERLIIRAPRPGDAPALVEAVNASLEHLRPWMPWAAQPAELEETEQRVRLGAARWLAREDLWLMLIRKADDHWLGDSGRLVGGSDRLVGGSDRLVGGSGRLVGGSGLHRINWRVPHFEIGYWIRADAEGQGYVTEAVNGITAFAFDVLGAERVMIRCDSLNTRSAAVAERCGYTFEGLMLHDDRGVDGALRDTQVYSLIRPEWLARKEAPHA